MYTYPYKHTYIIYIYIYLCRRLQLCFSVKHKIEIRIRDDVGRSGMVVYVHQKGVRARVRFAVCVHQKREFFCLLKKYEIRNQNNKKL